MQSRLKCSNVIENNFTNIDLYPSVKVIREDNLSRIFLQFYSFNWCIFHEGLTKLWFWFIIYWQRFVETLAVGDFSNGAPFFLGYQGKFLKRIIPWTIYFMPKNWYLKVLEPNLAEYPRQFPSFPSWSFHPPPSFQNCQRRSISGRPPPAGWSHPRTASWGAGTWSPGRRGHPRASWQCPLHPDPRGRRGDPRDHRHPHHLCPEHARARSRRGGREVLCLGILNEWMEFTLKS